MKSTIMMLAAGLSLGVIACNDSNTASNTDSDTTTTGSLSTTSNNAANAGDNTYADVPAGTRTSFETKYPNASNVRWNRYQPADRSTMEPGDWNYNLDSNDYEVMFSWDGMDYRAWYDDGNWIRESTRVSDHSKLPASVNDAIRSQFSGYTITEVDKEHDKDRTTYEVDLEKGGDKLKVHFDENGKVVKKKGTVNGSEVKKKEEDNH
ncbi:MAG TPA: PepSY-like domain-containing protein [Chitinophagaceae bacterium]|nr:PepSY-like domain-containing protein [Chitinophagaceae bacterium]